MRLLHSVTLARMLLRYFARRVLHIGALRSGFATFLAGAGVVVPIAIFVGAVYIFLDSLSMDDEAWSLLFTMAAIAVVLWAQIAFLIVKTLFSNAQGMLALSFRLPLTNRERAAGFLICEAAMIAAVTGILSAGLVGASILLRGPAVVPRLLEAIVFPAVLTYLVLGVVYQLMAAALARLPLRRIGGPVMIVAMFALLLGYATQLGSITSQVSRAYLDHTDPLVWVGILGWLSRSDGFAVMLGAFLTIAGALTVIMIRLTPHQHVNASRYLNCSLELRVLGRLNPYDRALIRSAQTWLAAWVALATFTFLCINPVVNPLWGFVVLTVGGFYQFAATLPLRMMVGGPASPWAIYGRLIKAHIVVFAIFLVPGTIIAGLVNIDHVVESPLPIVGCVGSVLLVQWVGVAFPAEDDNPFSVLVGRTVAIAVLGTVGITVAVLRLPLTVIVVGAVLVVCALVRNTVEGIRVDESRRRHEEIGPPRRRPHWFRRVDAADRGRDSVVPDAQPVSRAAD
ncbi:hypothetical protein [Nocardia sp. NPDC051463]|uniref:hypothetical protein n=1 Tax=Nocardia sp. NPDC051463 TaxID=3154845 RepID=UPI00344E9504